MCLCVYIFVYILCYQAAQGARNIIQYVASDIYIFYIVADMLCK
jgi:hypothetical protein